MSELRDLYQDILLDHNRRPRNRGRLENATHEAQGHNPLCGDQVHVYLQVAGDRVEAVSFEGEGCAISVASASMLTEVMRGQSLADAESIFESFRAAMTTETGTLDSLAEEHAELLSLAGVKEYPVRVKCATLAWHAFHAALQGKRQASTE